MRSSHGALGILLSLLVPAWVSAQVCVGRPLREDERMVAAEAGRARVGLGQSANAAAEEGEGTILGLTYAGAPRGRIAYALSYRHQELGAEAEGLDALDLRVLVSLRRALPLPLSPESCVVGGALFAFPEGTGDQTFANAIGVGVGVRLVSGGVLLVPHLAPLVVISWGGGNQLHFENEGARARLALEGGLGLRRRSLIGEAGFQLSNLFRDAGVAAYPKRAFVASLGIAF